MSKHIHFCKNCDKYTIEEICPFCKKKTQISRPAKFSPKDKYGQYRREIKKEELERKKLY